MTTPKRRFAFHSALLLGCLVYLLWFAGFLRAAELWHWTADAPHHAAVVQITCGSAGGSGCLIARDEAGPGLVLTAAHVVEAGGALTIRWTSGEQAAGRTLTADRNADLAIIQTNSTPPHAVTVPPGDQPPPAGAVVEINGFGGPGNHLRHFTGVVRSDSSGQQLKADAWLLNGDSGGPIIYGGHVIGANSGGYEMVNVGLVDRNGHNWPAHRPALAGCTYPLRRLLAQISQPWANHLAGCGPRRGSIPRGGGSSPQYFPPAPAPQQPIPDLPGST